MSSAAAGKFQDHYKVLGIDPKSDSTAIQAAYSKLAPHHHPKNGIAPDQEKFDALNLAFEVLSDPGLRSTFDSLRGGQEEAPVNFSGLPFFAAVKKEALIRNALMCLLYDYRRLKPRTPGISLRQIEPAILANYEELQLAIWYLKTKGFIIMDDKSRLEITVAGMDDMLKNLPEPQSVITMFKDITPNLEEPQEAQSDSATLSILAAPYILAASTETPIPAPLTSAPLPSAPLPAPAPPVASTPVASTPVASTPVSLLSLSAATTPAATTPAPLAPSHPAEPLTLRLSTNLRRGPSANG